ncbi:serine hydrolase domain-containing protein [Pseudoalteromonas luteoviolacea]|uniref:Beta-lactamase-related domain-containing protein n=1 Tax=Pseudoalteromonas luteoviolacea S4060-1 TaxID=1365257 RepID=A0A167NSE4_9GAMM|nr:serine hydrolase domain-containing protein [Pseudoalteromonas luteoviolacea]KZN68708.1 hypothetical protein N478_13665 [Pseudoalteromonas luteoviolacea S4060-1]
MNQLKYKTVIALIMFGLSACDSNFKQDTFEQAQLETKQSQQQGAKQLDYQALINSLISNEVHGIILHVSSPRDSFTASAGLANLTTLEALQPDAVYHLASSGKVFTALLAVQLHEEGLLDLDLTIDHWLPHDITSQIQYSGQITLRQLLNHSSGIYNYSDPLSEDAYVEFVMANYKSGISNEDLLQFAYGQPGYFKPGGGVKYSNSNYVLAGMIMDSVLGHPNALAMRDKIIDRLALSDTFSVGIEHSVAQLTPGYEKQAGTFVNTGPILSQVTAASTPVASSVTDVATVMRSIFKDDTWLSQAEREALLGDASRVKVSANLDYVLGLWKEEFNGFTVFHHNGGNHGYISNNIYVPELDVSIVYFLNCGLSEPCINAFNTIEQQVKQHVIAH